MVQTGAEPTADERADQLQYHDRLVMHEPAARGKVVIASDQISRSPEQSEGVAIS